MRGALAFGLAWLLLPHHPNLGLTVVAQPGDAARAIIFARLQEVRSEIRNEEGHRKNIGGIKAREAALRKAGRLPDEAPLLNFLFPAGDQS